MDPVLFLDLDLLIMGSPDDFFEIGGLNDLIMARNLATPLERLGGTLLFRFPVGTGFLQAKFRADPHCISGSIAAGFLR
ncbi:hypothetical protein PYH37_001677 [Sinorhizobium numidicum]|uniref:Uncharacterized protein n=1 Tax=Sinorhizobium numidicum TaxID=680248 RepID=A0ABY8CS28_9HYPH|nr:hypothetical protein [Sinorhizobium numidicum]WEX74281.1 hypothetical protein PYH37_001677 [Sinorhizobium numidicum]WEX80267.1 hypothetical protein PYH38_001678 [Sinorhizobium numidicum]